MKSVGSRRLFSYIDSKLLQEILNDGMLSIGLVMGHELQLFDALAVVSSEKEPATCTMVAEKADMKER